MVLAKAAVGLLLVIALALAAWGRPPRRPAPAADLRWLLIAAGALYGAAVASLVLRRDLLAEATCAAGVLSAALAAWLSRGRRPPREDPPAGPPVDWDDFDRARGGWERPRTPSRSC